MTVCRTRRCLPLLLLGTVLMSPPAFAFGGEEVYVREGCVACHGMLGEGGVGPALAGDRLLANQYDVVARILLGGGEMRAFAGQISDDDLAAVASYIRESWGNHFGKVPVGQVKDDIHHLKSGIAKSHANVAPQTGNSQKQE